MADERVPITSPWRDLADFFDSKMAEKASELEFGGIEVVMDMGRWIEKNEAT
jgi:hypothetical protein